MCLYLSRISISNFQLVSPIISSLVHVQSKKSSPKWSRFTRFTKRSKIWDFTSFHFLHKLQYTYTFDDIHASTDDIKSNSLKAIFVTFQVSCQFDQTWSSLLSLSQREAWVNYLACNRIPRSTSIIINISQVSNQNQTHHITWPIIEYLKQPIASNKKQDTSNVTITICHKWQLLLHFTLLCIIYCWNHLNRRPCQFVIWRILGALTRSIKWPRKPGISYGYLLLFCIKSAVSDSD